MRVFIGSSGEQKALVYWLTSFIRKNFKQLEPVPWTAPWESGKFTLENLEEHIRDTDASILFWTPDDPSMYHGVEKRYEPRDNLLIEAGMFIAAHGRDRTQLLIPTLPPDDERGKVAIPSDFWGLTWNNYEWVEGVDIATTGLPDTAQTVCKRLLELGPRTRPPLRLQHLAQNADVEDIRTYVGAWSTIHVQGIRKLAEDPLARRVDIMAAYRVGEIRHALDQFEFKNRKGATLRACFANVWDVPLAECYQRKYYNRRLERMQQSVQESIEFLLGPCRVEGRSDEAVSVAGVSHAKVSVTDVTEPPTADYDLRLTRQRITMGYYRVDDVAFIVPLDMKREQKPQPLVWVLDKSTAPGAFKHYQEEFTKTFEESLKIYPSR